MRVERGSQFTIIWKSSGLRQWAIADALVRLWLDVFMFRGRVPSNIIDRVLMSNDQMPAGAREEFERDGQRISTFISRVARVFFVTSARSRATLLK
jgi:hypothetical protein